jgi:hypothetical protein
MQIIATMSAEASSFGRIRTRFSRVVCFTPLAHNNCLVYGPACGASLGKACVEKNLPDGMCSPIG